MDRIAPSRASWIAISAPGEVTAGGVRWCRLMDLDLYSPRPAEPPGDR
jgi:hypothetical protein